MPFWFVGFSFPCFHIHSNTFLCECQVFFSLCFCFYSTHRAIEAWVISALGLQAPMTIPSVFTSSEVHPCLLEHPYYSTGFAFCQGAFGIFLKVFSEGLTVPITHLRLRDVTAFFLPWNSYMIP